MGGRGPERRSPQDDAAEQLAHAVSAQWVRELELRRAYDPQPLQVHWHVVDSDLADHRDNIERRADSTRRELGDLSGSFAAVRDVYRMVPSERLLVLGGPGSGKTVLAIHFVLSVLNSRGAVTDRVPVLFNLGGWNPAVALRDWLADQLTVDYPMGRRLAVDLLDGNRILPVLDGFDEIVDGFHQAALTELSATTMPFLLTSRVDEFSAAVSDTGRLLSRAAVVQLDRIGIEDLSGYLPLTTRRTTTVGRNEIPMWTALLDEVDHNRESPGSQNFLNALATPLMATLARTVYSDDPRRDPAELLDAQRFSTARAIEEHLLASFVPATYYSSAGKDPARIRRYEQWFGFLARHLDDLGTFDLAWWRLAEAVPRPTRSLLMGAFAALASGLPIALALFLFSVPDNSHLIVGGMVGGAVLLATWSGRRLLAGAAFSVTTAAVLGSIALSRGLDQDAIMIGATATGAIAAVLYLLAGRSRPVPSYIVLSLRRPPEVLVRKIRFGIGGGAVAVACVFFVHVAGLNEDSLLEKLLGPVMMGVFVGLYTAVMSGISFRWRAGRAAVWIAISTSLWLGVHFLLQPDKVTPKFLLSLPAAAAIGVVLSMLRIEEVSPGGAGAEFSLRTIARTLGLVIGGGLAGGLCGTLFAVTTVANGTYDTRRFGPIDYLLDMTAIGIVTGTLIGLIARIAVSGVRSITEFERNVDLNTAISPMFLLRLDRKNSLLSALVYVIPLGSLTMILFAPVRGVVTGLTTTALVALVIGILTGVSARAWGRWVIVTRFWLPLTGRLPWRLTGFLTDAHRRGVLRQVGAVYQFRHARLQAYLAHNYSNE
ncbi:NACHT domain-containing protein [Lentzea sp. NEAU-D13]|uniref:NACHT domain-containing protein n=1 Tax=Lentzea alba TaxID=2714351 RepID=A0A7C9VY38_9PSEU|nr:NACHT domain-containing protein [Lentzea alba]NGY60697.1 NACHT domain-containing protein [Lentzea alba]